MSDADISMIQHVTREPVNLVFIDSQNTIWRFRCKGISLLITGRSVNNSAQWTARWISSLKVVDSIPIWNGLISENVISSHIQVTQALGSLMVRAADYRPEGLGSMPVLLNTLRVQTEFMLVKSVGPKVLWDESRMQGTEENFPPLQVHA
ncbi:hypothetical protein TNCV_2193271 [Trichonephila clavipes]|nr:hypothetical protein TNCV_2193271 [Trichonephila clavipes]